MQGANTQKGTAITVMYKHQRCQFSFVCEIKGTLNLLPKDIVYYEFATLYILFMK